MEPKQYRILVVDDLPDNVLLLRSLLEEEGYVVDVAEDGDAALLLLEASVPDLILLDVMMPGRNGYELTRDIRRELSLSEVPIVLITASTESCRIKGLASCATEFVRKPIDLDELLTTIQRLLQHRRKQSMPTFSPSNT